jgi:segregation and condensation protein A
MSETLEAILEAAPTASLPEPDLEASPGLNPLQDHIERALGTRDRGIEILVDLARQGQIDPWDIDVLDVTDKYLGQLDLTRETDLRLSGRALLYAATLLRLKGDAMRALTEEPAVEDAFGFEDDHLEYDESATELVVRPPVSLLDRALARRASVKQPRTRRISLVELITELQRIEELEREGMLLRDNALRRSRPTAADLRQRVIEQTHLEDLEGEMDRLAAQLGAWLAETGTVTLDEVLSQCPDRRGAFLALLFLDSRGKITLSQAEIYGPVTISPEESLTHDATLAA